MNIASATKLVTSVAAMQCIERSLIGLDDDMRPLVPILKGFNAEGKPIMEDPNEKVMLR